MHESQIIIKLILALVLGGLIGWERERDKKPAGLRTHILVCLGAALLASISLLLEEKFPYKADISRLAAGVIMGIGFLGAGAIIQAQGRVEGLTTAASIWLVAGIGLAVGFGFYFSALLTTIFVMLTLIILFHLEKFIGGRGKDKKIWHLRIKK